MAAVLKITVLFVVLLGIMKRQALNPANPWTTDLNDSGAIDFKEFVYGMSHFDGVGYDFGMVSSERKRGSASLGA